MSAGFDAEVSTSSPIRAPSGARAASCPVGHTAQPGALAETRPRWPIRWARGVLAAPFALGLSLALLGTTVWMRLHPSAAAAALEWASTNIENLAHAPLRSFVMSALFLPDGRWLPNAVLLLLVLVPLERRIGTLRALAVFASAHVVATIVTEGAVWLAVLAGAVPASVEHQDDVGISYGLYAVAAATCYFLPRRIRPVAVAALGLWLLVPFATSPDMTSCGHVLSLTIGLLWWAVLGRMATTRRTQPPRLRPAGGSRRRQRSR